MPRRTPQDYSGAPIDADYAPFDEVKIGRILAEVGESFALVIDRSEFMSRLNDIAKLSRVRRSAAEMPSSSQDKLFLCDLQRAARTLGARLPHHTVPGDEGGKEFGLVPSFGVLRLVAAPLSGHLASRRASVSEDDPQHLSPLSTHLDTLAEADISTPDDVLAIATAVCAILEQTAATALESFTPAGHPTPGTAEVAVTALMRLYRDAFDRRIAFSRPGKSGDPGGPMIRFVLAACGVLGFDLSPATIAKIKQRHFPAT